MKRNSTSSVLYSAGITAQHQRYGGNARNQVAARMLLLLLLITQAKWTAEHDRARERTSRKARELFENSIVFRLLAPLLVRESERRKRWTRMP